MNNNDNNINNDDINDMLNTTHKMMKTGIIIKMLNDIFNKFVNFFTFSINVVRLFEKLIEKHEDITPHIQNEFYSVLNEQFDHMLQIYDKYFGNLTKENFNYLKLSEDIQNDIRKHTIDITDEINKRLCKFNAGFTNSKVAPLFIESFADIFLEFFTDCKIFLFESTLGILDINKNNKVDVFNTIVEKTKELIQMLKEIVPSSIERSEVVNAILTDNEIKNITEQWENEIRHLLEEGVNIDESFDVTKDKYLEKYHDRLDTIFGSNKVKVENK